MKTIKDKKEIAKALDMDVHIKDGGVVNIKSLAPKVTKIVNMEDKRDSDEYEFTEKCVFGDYLFSTVQQSFRDWLKNKMNNAAEELGIDKTKVDTVTYDILGKTFVGNLDEFENDDVIFDYDIPDADYTIKATITALGEEDYEYYHIDITDAKEQLLANSKRLFYKK